MTSSYDRIAKALRFDDTHPSDSSHYGTVVSVNNDGSYQVALGPNDAETRCAKLCVAAIGDRVFVIKQASGQCAAIAKVGGGGGGGGEAEWGSIGGIISDQTDLQNALDAKADFVGLADVATSGDYADLENAPSLATVATTGDYDDLTDKPNLAAVATSGAYSDLSGKPTLATVATSGSYNDLTDKPSLAAVATSGDYSDLDNTPSLAAVATSGQYSDLSGTPSLAAVATTGDYDDLSNKPSIHNVPSGGSSGQVLSKATAADYDLAWITPSGGSGGTFDLIYDTPLYWWDSGAITGTDSGSDDPSRAGMGYGELDYPITDYDFLILHFKAGDTNSLNNTRLTHVLPVGAIEYLTSSQINDGTKSQEFMYLYPAANPSWFIDVAYGFTDAMHVYAKRRTYSNIRYWNIDKIYGVKF